MLSISMRSQMGRLCRHCQRRFISGVRKIAEGDQIFLHTKDMSKTPLLTKPLRRDKIIQSHWGSIPHQAIIGKQARELVETSTGRQLLISIPTLDDYIRLSAGMVTPIFPADANLLVSLLDIHVSQPQSSSTERPLEILEAGTGNGALTLYLARAIHAANPLISEEILTQLRSQMTERQSQDDRLSTVTNVINDGTESGNNLSTTENIPAIAALERWKSERRAVIHTVDVSSHNSNFAKRMVRGFRRGMYVGNIDFHVSNVDDWIDQQLEKRGKDNPDPEYQTFLSHVILDLPGSYLSLAKASSALQTDGSLLVFNPSVTQIMACVNLIRELRLPLLLDRVLEIGSRLTGGREWDIRAVKPKAFLKAETEKKLGSPVPDVTSDTEPIETQTLPPGLISGQEISDKKQTELIEQEKIGWEMVCRPKDGSRFAAGGGFLGIWKKMMPRNI